MKRDPRIDAYLANAPTFARPILEHVRALVHNTLPGIAEDMKWGRPHFVHNGKNLAGMAAFKAHCAVMIHGDGRQGVALDYGKIATLADLPEDSELVAKLLAARDRIDKLGTALKRSVKRAAKDAIAVPQDFAAALRENGAARTTFKGFPSSQQREYVDWITDAKQDATRARRLATSIEWLAEGKRRNWKYER